MLVGTCFMRLGEIKGEIKGSIFFIFYTFSLVYVNLSFFLTFFFIRSRGAKCPI